MHIKTTKCNNAYPLEWLEFKGPMMQMLIKIGVDRKLRQD